MAGTKRSASALDDSNTDATSNLDPTTKSCSAKDLSWANNEAVTFEVGPDSVKFSIHKHFLITKIPHFKNHFGPDSKFEEGRTGRCKLPGVSPAVFNHIVTWIYRRKMPDLDPIVRKGRSEDDFNTLFEASVHAQRVYHGIIHEAEIWHCRALARDALDVLRRFHAVSATAVPPVLVYDGLKSVLGTEQTSDYKRWLMMCICADIGEGGRPVFQKHSLAANVLNDGKMDLFGDVIVRQAVEPKITVKSVMDPKRIFYEMRG